VLHLTKIHFAMEKTEHAWNLHHESNSAIWVDFVPLFTVVTRLRDRNRWISRTTSFPAKYGNLKINKRFEHLPFFCRCGKSHFPSLLKSVEKMLFCGSESPLFSPKLKREDMITAAARR